MFFDGGNAEGVVGVVLEAAVVGAQVGDFERDVSGGVERGVERLLLFPRVDGLHSRAL